MVIRFWVDPESRLPHIYNHGVTEEEVRQVLSRPKLNFPGSEGSRIVLGETSTGRPLKVVYVPDPDADSGFVVTAYDLRGKAPKAFRRAVRRKKR